MQFKQSLGKVQLLVITLGLAGTVELLLQVDRLEPGPRLLASRSLEKTSHLNLPPSQSRPYAGLEEPEPELELATLPVGRGPNKLGVVEGELLVKMKPGTPPEEIEQLVARVHSRVRGAGARSGLYRLEVPAGRSLEDFQASLREAPFVEDAHPNAVAVGTGCPIGTYRALEWNLDRIQETTACASYPPALPTIVVAVLDTGAAYENRTDSQYTYTAASDLSAVHFLPGYDFINNDPYPDDDNQHGTHITGIITAEGKVSGAAPAVQILPVKVLNASEQGTELSLVEGIYFAVDHGADVINMSLAFGTGYFPSSSLQDAIAYAADHGVVMVASSGNGGTWGVSYPAAFPEVISVGASRMSVSTSTGQAVNYQAHYSNRGYGLDLLAPGGLLNTDMNNDAYPDAVLAQAFKPNQPSQTGYWYMAGTSQAAAHVTSAVAWLLADGVPASEVRSTLLASADPMTLSNYDPYIGSGNLQLQAARDLAYHGGVAVPPPYYVNLLPHLIRGPNGGTQAVVRIQVIDRLGRPAAGVRVGGAWMGSYTAFDALATTGTDGTAQLTSGEVISSTGVAIGFRADIVAVPGSRFASRPLQFYSLSPASAEVYCRLMNDSLAAQSALFYELEPTDTGLDPLMSRSNMLTSFVVKPIGAGLRTGPLAIVFDQAFVPEITQAPSSAVTPLSWSFDAPLLSGRGLVSQMSGVRVDATSTRLGSLSHFLILPLDPAMALIDLNHYYPVLNANAPTFLADNQTFGNGFAASAMGSGFASSAMGSSFASRSLGDGFAASAMGSGFAASAMGSGFAASAMGSGFAASAMGSTANASQANGMSLLGATLEPVTSTVSTVTCTVTYLLPPLGSIDLGSLNSCIHYIKSETELQSYTGVPHYPK